MIISSNDRAIELTIISNLHFVSHIYLYLRFARISQNRDICSLHACRLLLVYAPIFCTFLCVPGNIS